MQFNFISKWSTNSWSIENFLQHCGNAGFPNRQDTGSALCVQMLLPGHMHTRVANVVADHDSLLTQWRPIKMSKFGANIFLIRTTSNYFWASEVFKNQRFKSHLFSFSPNKKYPKLKTWDDFYAIIILYS